MPFAEKKECNIQNKNYTHGEQGCDSDKCMWCHDGNWRETTQLFIL